MQGAEQCSCEWRPKRPFHARSVADVLMGLMRLERVRDLDCPVHGVAAVARRTLG